MSEKTIKPATAHRLRAPVMQPCHCGLMQGTCDCKSHFAAQQRGLSEWQYAGPDGRWHDIDECGVDSARGRGIPVRRTPMLAPKVSIAPAGEQRAVRTAEVTADLLEALKETRRVALAYFSGVDRGWLKRADAAIAKAEGKE